MTTERQEHVQEVRDGNYARRQRVIEYNRSTQDILVSRITKLMWLITAIITGLIIFRFVLMLIAANAANGFVNFIYDLTDIFVSPFSGIVNTPALDGGSIFDVASLFAIVVYVLAAWALITLFRIVFSGTRNSKRVSTFERQN